MTDRTDQALDTDLAHVGAEIGRADTKAALLVGLAGAALAVTGGAVKDYSLPAAAQITGGLGAATLVEAIVTLLLVVRPALGGSARHSWPHWATCTPEQVREQLREDRRAERLCDMARLASRKMHGIRRAVHLLLGGIGLLTFAALAAITPA
ncbi:Pycsar system effector family protein [Streptomyces sp. MZ04]|uniref:Pycsar system effector family protein n=1 Tax=Streptomyces sp. MZ04 TaxID=2559236 RepID=UPI00107EDF9B|nr:Pycsar system effector family protein [Streptomyces sp. MZ04]TGB06529.1 integral membrane plasmid transfer protein [Streptomyces sp. MZ04]